jgi:hypothetical protein
MAYSVLPLHFTRDLIKEAFIAKDHSDDAIPDETA